MGRISEQEYTAYIAKRAIEAERWDKKSLLLSNKTVIEAVRPYINRLPLLKVLE